MKTKLTFALVAFMANTAFAEFKAPLPEFKNEKQLAEWRAQNVSRATSQGYPAEKTVFYTGKPYLGSSGGYAFNYRNYNPDLVRWTSQDPSGFPDGSNNYAYGHTPNYGLDPSGLSWVVNSQVNFDLFNWENNNLNISMNWSAPTNKEATPYDLGQEWLFGVGPQSRSFTTNDVMTNYVTGHSAVNDARSQITGQLNSSSSNTNAVAINYDLSGIAGIPKYFGDYSSLLSFGNVGNLGVTFLGSYRGQVSVQSVDRSANTATLQYSIMNNSTISSATRPPVVGYWPWWQQYVAPQINGMVSGSGPLSTKTQTFTWTETISIE
jgi:RHS repeat-associated protein